jgi:hypothetical protein
LGSHLLVDFGPRESYLRVIPFLRQSAAHLLASAVFSLAAGPSEEMGRQFMPPVEQMET